MSFRIGQKVRIVRSRLPERIGKVATVISEPKPWNPGSDTDPSSWRGFLRPGELIQQLDLAVLPQHGPTGIVGYPPSWLEPIDDDGRDAIAWTDELRNLCGVNVKRTERA